MSLEAVKDKQKNLTILWSV